MLERRVSCDSCKGSAGVRTAEVPGGLSRIAVVGLGYVGLPTALSFAGEGAEVIGFDVDETRLTAMYASKPWW